MNTRRHPLPAALRRTFGIGCIVLPALAVPAAAQAWGELGHRITGRVAERLLTPNARIGITRLMGRVDLANDALYLDQNKAALEQRIPGSRQWHYDDRPVCAPDTPTPAYCANGDCASVQIARHYKVLADPHAAAGDRQFAVYVLAHLVGDIHQPLHASDHHDRGGNDVAVSFTLPGGRRVSNNLHAAWDTDFVGAAFKTGDDRRIAQDLIGSVGAGTLLGYQAGTAPAWLAESFDVASLLTYGRLPDFSCTSTAPADAAQAAASTAQAATGVRLVLNAAYVDRTLKRVPTQLLKAGARIAAVFNRAFAAASRDAAEPLSSAAATPAFADEPAAPSAR